MAAASCTLLDELVIALAALRLACGLALAAFLATTTPLASCLALLVVGVTAAPHHPLAQARAYRELPDHPGTVQALGQLFVVVDVAAPRALGVVADRWGLGAALACLLVQPLVVAACAAGLKRP